MDKHGYPDDEELQKIRDWDVKDPFGLIKFIESIWWNADWGFGITPPQDGETLLNLHTGGWSGNEDIIAALQENPFWLFYWHRSERGGHYFFRVKSFN